MKKKNDELTKTIDLLITDDDENKKSFEQEISGLKKQVDELQRTKSSNEKEISDLKKQAEVKKSEFRLLRLELTSKIRDIIEQNDNTAISKISILHTDDKNDEAET